MEQTPIIERDKASPTQLDKVSTLGKFASADELYKAYESLQREFTRRSQRLRQLERELATSQNIASGNTSEGVAMGNDAVGDSASDDRQNNKQNSQQSHTYGNSVVLDNASDRTSDSRSTVDMDIGRELGCETGGQVDKGGRESGDSASVVRESGGSASVVRETVPSTISSRGLRATCKFVAPRTLDDAKRLADQMLDRAGS